MFLRRPPSEWTLLKVLGPWPWYICSAAGVAIVLITLLDMPFWHSRHSTASRGRYPAASIDHPDREAGPARPARRGARGG